LHLLSVGRTETQGTYNRVFDAAVNACPIEFSIEIKRVREIAEYRRTKGSPELRMGQCVPRPRLVAAIDDRVTFNAHILETGTQSYRLRTSKGTAREKRAR
jgi:hypothetical protein